MKNLIVFIILTTFLNSSIMAKTVNSTEEAIFAMGCFWCGASAFADHETNEKLPGIISIKTGYTGGEMPAPTYKNHETHKEGVQIIFDPKIISYKQLLNIFWRNIDPFDSKGQFCDKGFAYSSAVFYKNKYQKELAIETRNETEYILKKPIVTELLPAKIFYPAEEYHQDYKSKNPIRYKYYTWSCGRAQRIEEIWNRK
jgi:peptide-methionine (S)-S-oxide reductase